MGDFFGIDVEAEDTCEQLVRLVLDTGDWEIPRTLVDSVLEPGDDHALRKADLLNARAAAYLPSLSGTVTPDQLDAAVHWIGGEYGTRYAGRAAIVAALAGHSEREALISRRLGCSNIDTGRMVALLGPEFFSALIWLYCGMVATLGSGDVEWLRKHKGAWIGSVSDLPVPRVDGSR